MLSEFHRGVTLVGVVGRDLTALSHSLLRRRFLLRRNDNCSQMRGRIARLASRWNSYLEYYTSYLAPMGVKIFFLFCCLRLLFLLPEALEGNKKEKRFPLPSGLDKTYSIPDNYSIGSPSEQHFAFELALEFELVILTK